MQWLRCSLVSKVQGRHCSIGHQAGILNVGERDQPRTCGEAPTQIGSNSYCQSGFANTARPHESDESGRCELLLDFRQLMAAPNEAGRLKG